MQLIENLRLAFTSLLANKMRALLTMLGIIIGISAVILITTIGTSIQKTLTNTFNSLGNFNIFTVDVWLNENDDGEGFIESEMISREMIDEVIAMYPGQFSLEMSQSGGTVTTQNENGDVITMDITGVMDVVPAADHLRGRTIQYKDSQNNKNAIYVTDLFVRQYFPEGTDPIGQTVNLTFENGVSADFTIVGYDKLPKIYEKEFAPGTKEIDKTTPAAVPLDSLLSILHQEIRPNDRVYIRYNTDYDMETMQQELQEFFEEKYAEYPRYYITVRDQQSELGMINTVINIVTIAISVIAAISLIVGGVGVMNIMLVSITERTKEIGIRKALGAQNSAIRLQFVVEAIMICLIGGLIGIMLGIFGGMAIGWIAKLLVEQFYAEYAELIAITIQPSIPAILVAVFFSILTGVFFGYYPANKAAHMNPIDALRYD
ncbi:MAG: ABC transporter permease [Oscillospiraceae bacterium]|nr:ABC transporter permease [Oscillospiraceae bacterium]